MSLLSSFRNTPPEFAPLAFWFWNGDLEAGKLAAQARDMFRRGVRGFFMHGRGGLVRPAYLSRGWMRLVESVVGEAKRLGAKAWLYDEMGWPSGSAGGRVPRLGPEYQQKFIECIPVPVRGRSVRLAPGRQIVAAFHSPSYPPAGRKDLLEVTDRLGGSGVLDASGLKGGWLLAFAVGSQPGYIDTLSPRPVAAFIRLTHEAYKRRIGSHFGRTVPGIFTDEPSHRAYDLRAHVLKAPWTQRLPSAFEARRGYSLPPALPALFFDVGDFERTRHDFWQIVSELFVAGYGEPLYEWCERNGIAFTGHYEYEVPLHMQIQCLSAAMPLYRRMQIPGLDLLGRNRPRYERPESIVLAKQPASVANQCGRHRVLCEAFGTGGWDFGPERAKWQADWLFALGVNMLCIHGLYYSIAGDRKFDAPPDFLRQPWWEISKPLHDHYARVCQVLSQGKPTREIAVIHPVRAAWTKHRPQDNVGVCDREDSAMGRAFGALLEALTEAHLDYDLVDEGFLQEARVRRGVLIVGAASYRVAIVPPLMKVIEPWTASLLNELAGQGGSVISLSEVERVHGRRAGGPVLGRDVRLAAGRQAVAAAARMAARALGERTRLTGPGAGAVAMHERDLGRGRRAIFLSNSSLEEVRAQLRPPGAWRIEEWDTGTGEMHAIGSRQDGDETTARLLFAPAQSHLLMLARGDTRGRSPRTRPKRRTLAALDSWRVEAAAPNVLTFDHCRVRRAGSKAWSRVVPVSEARKRSGVSAVRFQFGNSLPPGSGRRLSLAFEGAEGVEVRANGKRLERIEARLPRHLDFCSTADVSKAALPGKNLIELAARHGTLRAEAAYLLGDFGLEQAGPAVFALKGPHPEVGPWHECGFPFFGGPMRYSCDFSLGSVPPGGVFLEVDSLSEAAAVRVNGKKAGEMLWRPWRVEVTGLLRPGRNALALLVYGSLRNAFGPWHFPGDARCAGFSSQHWTHAVGWTDRYTFVPYGLLGKARLTLASGG